MENFKIQLDFATEFLKVMPNFTIKSSELHRAGDALIRNVERLARFAKMPPSLMGLAGLIQEIWCKASHKVTGQTNIFSTGNILEEVRTECLRLINNSSGWHDGHMYWHCKETCEPLETMELGGDNFIAETLQVFVAAQTILAWTLFETVVGDLWIAAVNARPNILGKKASDYELKGEGKAQSKSIRFDVIQSHGFDLTDKLGDVYSYKFDFGDLFDAKKAYELAFGKENKVSNVFVDSTITALRLTRNLLVHQGGVADKKFVNKIAKTGFFADVKDKSPITVSYKYASDFSSVAAHSAAKIFIFVDEWLQSHSD